MSKLTDVIERETTDIEQEAAISAHAHFVASRRWERVNLGLGVPSTLLAAAAGVTAFIESLPPAVTGGAALVVAAITGLNTFLSPGDRAVAHRTVSATFRQIRREASLLRDVDAQLANPDDEATTEELAERLREMTAKLTDIDQHAPGISASAKSSAEKKFGQQFIEPVQPGNPVMG